MVVEEDEPPDKNLTVKTIQNTTMARNDIPKVLDPEGPLEPARKEPPEGANERDERANQNAVEVIGVPGHLAHRNEELGSKKHIYLFLVSRQGVIRFHLNLPASERRCTCVE